jgi:hypothetical protein
MIVVGRSEHPFMSICDLHEQLLLSIEQIKIVVTFASCFLMAYKSRFTFIGSHYTIMILFPGYGLPSWTEATPPHPSPSQKNQNNTNF